MGHLLHHGLHDRLPKQSKESGPVVSGGQVEIFAVTKCTASFINSAPGLADCAGGGVPRTSAFVVRIGPCAFSLRRMGPENVLSPLGD